MRATRMTLKYLTTTSKSLWKQGHHVSLGAEYNSLYRHRTSNRGASKRPRVSGVFPPHHSACTEAPLTEVGHIRRSLQYQTPYPNPALSPTAPNITLQGL